MHLSGRRNEALSAKHNDTEHATGISFWSELSIRNANTIRNGSEPRQFTEKAEAVIQRVLSE